MSRTISIVPALIDALVSTLRARAALTGIQVEPAWPGDNPESESIFVTSTRVDSEIANMRAGRKHRNEDPVIGLTVLVQRHDSPSATRDRAYVLYAEVENALADSPTLGGLDGLLWASITRHESETFGVEPGLARSIIEVEIATKARLT